VIDVGEGVTSLVAGDHVIPCYTPECRESGCIFCASPKTNLCPKIRGTQGKGVMPDGTSRFRSARTGETLWHFMGCSTFAEVTVLAEISCAKIAKEAPLADVCLLGCGISTGWGAVWNTCKVEAGASVAVFGLGAVGLAVVQAAKLAGARAIYAIGAAPRGRRAACVLPARSRVLLRARRRLARSRARPPPPPPSPLPFPFPFPAPLARSLSLLLLRARPSLLRCAACRVQTRTRPSLKRRRSWAPPTASTPQTCRTGRRPRRPSSLRRSGERARTRRSRSRASSDALPFPPSLPPSRRGVDYTFDCTGNTNVMRTALEAAHRGWGVSCVIGVAASGHEIATRPFQLVTGRTWKGTAFGGWKSRSHVPQLVARVQRGELSVAPFISLRLDGVAATNEAVAALHGGSCLRAVVRYVPELCKPCASPPEGGGGAALALLSEVSAHGGRQLRFRHRSAALGCEMAFSLFLPKAYAHAGPGGARAPSPAAGVPCVLWLSGLTCTDENAVQKAGFQTHASRLGLAVLYADTSPRGAPIEGDSESWDFGKSAAFYLDATQPPWASTYRMETYLLDELLPLARAQFGLGAVGVSGHSMGGHGALTLALRRPGAFAAVSAVAPICKPTGCPWGVKAFTNYLGSVEAGEAHDACALVRARGGPLSLPILADFGAADPFLNSQLLPEELRKACAEANAPLTLRYHAGCDHSYLFVASVAADHLEHHARALGAGAAAHTL
jgi:S-formylglutathione hydrolase